MLHNVAAVCCTSVRWSTVFYLFTKVEGKLPQHYSFYDIWNNSTCIGVFHSVFRDRSTLLIFMSVTPSVHLTITLRVARSTERNGKINKKLDSCIIYWSQISYVLHYILSQYSACHKPTGNCNETLQSIVIIEDFLVIPIPFFYLYVCLIAKKKKNNNWK